MGNPNWPISRSVVSAPGRCLLVLGDFSPGSGRKPPFQKLLDDVQSTLTRWFEVTFLGWLSDLLERLSDLQLGDEKGTLNHQGLEKWWKLRWTFQAFEKPPRKILPVLKTRTFFGMVSKKVTRNLVPWLHDLQRGQGIKLRHGWVITWTNYRFFGIPPYFFGCDFCWEKQSGSKRGGERNSWEFLQLQKNGGCLLSI